MQLGATLYLKNSLEAVDYYMQAFGMTLGYHVKHDDGSFLHAELEKNGHTIFCVSEAPESDFAKAMLATPLPTMSYGLDFDTEQEVRQAYALLSDGGHVLRPLGELPWSPLSADVVDRYGVYWYITLPQHRPED